MQTVDVQIDVQATEFIQDKVADSIHTLNVVCVATVGAQKPGKLCGNQLFALCVRPKLRACKKDTRSAMSSILCENLHSRMHSPMACSIPRHALYS
eukprot:365679-Chlamydomonas_euryale.AAC.28